MMSYGKFTNCFTEYEVNEPETVHAIDNYLWNEKVFSHVTHTGMGYIWYDDKNTEITRITTGGDCEFLYDKYYNRLIYIRDNDTGEYWNLNWEPVLKRVERFSCRHGLGYTIISSLVNDIQAELLLFIPPGKDSLEIWRLHVRNLSKTRKNLSIFTYCEIRLQSVDTYGEVIYQQATFDNDINGILSTKRAETLPHDNFTAFLTTNYEVAGFDCSKDSFVGQYGMLNKPKVVENGNCQNSQATREYPITVLQLKLELQPEGSSKADFLFGICANKKDVQNYRQKYFQNDGISKSFEVLKSKNAQLQKFNRISSPDENLNTLINIWNKHQIEYGAFWSRWGLRGYRDVVQHTMSLALFKPQEARDILMTAMKYQYKNGRGLRSWCPIDERAYADSSLWLIFAVAKYLKETGDLAFLDESVPYFDGEFATIYEHLNAAVDFSWQNRGNHGLCLIKFGDWNDSLTQVGKNGKGESVWLTMALARATLEIAQLALVIGDDDKCSILNCRHSVLKEVINDVAWQDDRYIRAFDDNGNPIGVADNKEGKIYLNTQSWAVLGGVSIPEQVDIMINTIDELLLTPLGYALLAPSYKEYASNIGRITNMQPGIAENGTIYSHGNAFMMLAFLELGMADKAYNIYKRIAPIYAALSQETTGSVPYVFPNCYYGPEHKTKPLMTEYSWVTGSVAWFYLNIIEWMFGLRSDYGALLIDPCLPTSWKKCSATRYFRDKEFHVTYERHSTIDEMEILLNGKHIHGNKIEPGNCQKVNEVTVMLPVKNTNMAERQAIVEEILI